MKKFYRALMVILVFFLIGMTLLTVRYCFDRRDMKSAVDLVTGYRFGPLPPLTLGELMFNASGSVVTCQARVVSRYEKKLRVNCFAGEDSSPAHEFLWTVDLSRQSVLPEGETAQELVAPYYSNERPLRF